MPPASTEIAVVGAGIVGLAVARELRLRRPDLDVAVFEREQAVGRHQTGHSSGVIHAGIYYAPGSLKARLCVEGARELYDYCDARGIAANRCGKLIVALDESELAGLDELERRGRANGVPGLARLDRDGLRAIEPHAAGIAALHSPNTGVVDFERVAESFADDVGRERIHLGCAVDRVDDGLVVHAAGQTRARYVVTCAGPWSSRLAVRSGAPADPRIVPFRGSYLRIEPGRDELVRALIYPVPDPRLPFLGVHFTRDHRREVMIGPTALLRPTRDALTWPGTYRMARRFWRTGVKELTHAVSRAALVRDARRYVPELSASDVAPAMSGVRAQALARDGSLVDDFVFSQTERALHVRNAPSPGATSSLAIAKLIADRAEQAFA
jgi:(S)-2-hydroxyglutarate dehydrogenase